MNSRSYKRHEPCITKMYSLEVSMKNAQVDQIKDSTVRERIFSMNKELVFLWTEAYRERIAEIRQRKLLQYWSLYRVYRRQREFLLALVQE